MNKKDVILRALIIFLFYPFCSCEVFEDVNDVIGDNNPSNPLSISRIIDIGGEPVNVDGYLSDWDEKGLLGIDPIGDNKGAIPGTDIKSVYGRISWQTFYLAIQLQDITGQPDVTYSLCIDFDVNNNWDCLINVTNLGKAELVDIRDQNVSFDDLTLSSISMSKSNEILETSFLQKKIVEIGIHLREILENDNEFAICVFISTTRNGKLIDKLNQICRVTYTEEEKSSPLPEPPNYITPVN